MKVFFFFAKRFFTIEGEGALSVKTAKIQSEPQPKISPGPTQALPLQPTPPLVFAQPKNPANANISKIQANFAKCKVNDPDPNVKTVYPEVEKFLESINLVKYHELFVTNGFEDLESILELQDDHFQTMGIPLGHKLKMLKRIREIRKDQPASAPPCENAVIATNLPPTVLAETEQKSVNFEGEFNEEENHKEFLAAREAWLKERQKDKEKLAQKTEKQEIGIGEDQNEEIKQKKPEEKKKSIFFLETGGNAWNVNCLPEFSEDGTGMSPKNAKKVEPKDCCFGCFKLFKKGEGFIDEKTEKLFCTDKCANKYFEEHSVKCLACAKQIMRDKGFLGSNGWLCSEDCMKKIAKTGTNKGVNEQKEKISEVERIDLDEEDMLKLE